MTLMKLRLGFLCSTALTFWNISGGYLDQTFNSQSLRGDLIFNNFESDQPSTQKTSPEIFKTLLKARDIY